MDEQAATPESTVKSGVYWAKNSRGDSILIEVDESGAWSRLVPRLIDHAEFIQEWYVIESRVIQYQRSEMDFLMSEISELDRLIEHCPEDHVIDLMGLKARRENVKNQLKLRFGCLVREIEK